MEPRVFLKCGAHHPQRAVQFREERADQLRGSIAHQQQSWIAAEESAHQTALHTLSRGVVSRQPRNVGGDLL